MPEQIQEVGHFVLKKVFWSDFGNLLFFVCFCTWDFATKSELHLRGRWATQNFANWMSLPLCVVGACKMYIKHPLNMSWKPSFSCVHPQKVSRRHIGKDMGFWSLVKTKSFLRFYPIVTSFSLLILDPLGEFGVFTVACEQNSGREVRWLSKKQTKKILDIFIMKRPTKKSLKIKPKLL